MYVYGELLKAGVERVAGAATPLFTGRIWLDTVAVALKVYDGTLTRTYVSLDQVQALTNKTLTSAVLTTPQTDVVTFDDQTTPSTPAAGFQKLYAKSDKKLYTLTSDGNELALAVGNASGINFISNGDFEGNTVSPWITYADAAASSPVDGTGGSPTITFAATAVTPLDGIYSALLTKTAVNSQGQGASINCAIPLGYRSKVTKVSFVYSASVDFDYGNALDGADPSDLTVWAIDTTSGQVFALAPNGLDGSGLFEGVFQSTQNATIRICFHIGTTNALAWTFKVDNIVFTPSEAVYGPNIVDFNSYTPVLSTTSGTITNATTTGFVAYTGDCASIKGQTTFSGVGGTFTDFLISLPFTINTAKINATTSGITPFGTASMLDLSASLTYGPGVVNYQSTTTVGLRWSTAVTHSGTVANQNNASSGTFPVTIASGDVITWQASDIPVLGRQSNIVVNNGDGRAVAFKADATGAIGGSVYTTMTLGTPSIDNTAIRSGDTLVIKEFGYYTIGGLILCEDTGWAVNEQLVAAYSVNGGGEQIFARFVQQGTFSGKVIVSGSSIAELKPGDVVRYRVYSDETGALSESFVFLMKTPIAGTLGASSILMAQFGKSAGQSITANTLTTVTWDTTYYDTMGGINLSTEIWTCPIAGWYTHSVKLASEASASTFSCRVDFYKNGTAFELSEGSSKSGTASLSHGLGLATSTSFFNPGETMEIRTNITATVTLLSDATLSRAATWNIRKEN